MTDLKTPEQLAVMAEGGHKLGLILQDLLEMSQPGVSLLEIENRAQELIKKSGGTPSFQTVEDYRWATCLCVNDVVVHGIPTKYILMEGDVLTVDVGLLYGGWHTDTAWTKIIHGPGYVVSSTLDKFVDSGRVALEHAIDQAQAGKRIGDISQALENKITGDGYAVVRTLVGHGVGRELHEDPQVPGFLRGPVEKTLELQPGLTIAIEIIYSSGRGEIVYDNDDGWTIATKDGSLAAVFEHTVAITASGPRVLTRI